MARRRRSYRPTEFAAKTPAVLLIPRKRPESRRDPHQLFAARFRHHAIFSIHRRRSSFVPHPSLLSGMGRCGRLDIHLRGATILADSFLPTHRHAARNEIPVASRPTLPVFRLFVGLAPMPQGVPPHALSRGRFTSSGTSARQLFVATVFSTRSRRSTMVRHLSRSSPLNGKTSHGGRGDDRSVFHVSVRES